MFSILTLYIIRQMLVPFILITLTLSGIIETLHAFRLLGKVIISGQGFGVWFELLLYLLPKVLLTIMPYAFMLSVFYAFYRLFMDNEITIMFSAGISRLRLVRPVMIFGVFISIILLLLNFYASPFSYQMLKQRVIRVDSDIANAMLRPGVFTNPVRGITAFINSRDDKGFIKGIFFQDGRDKNKPVSYIAESGALVSRNNQTKLIMFNGHVQYYERNSTGKINITSIKFDRYSYDLSQLIKPNAINIPLVRELYPEQLYQKWLDQKTSIKNKKDIFHLFIDALLESFYIIAYGLLALAAFLPAQISRTGYAKRISVAIVACLAVRLSGFIPLDYGKNITFYLTSSFAVPAFASLAATFIIMRGVGVLARLRHRFANAALAKTPIAKITTIEVI